MRCPYCRTPLTEHSPECPACRLTLDRAATLLGPIPRMLPGIGDLAGLLRTGDKKRIRRAITRIEWNFPQVHFHLLVHSFSAEHPFELNVFWFFNSGGISGEHEKGGKNHTILLAIDPDQAKAALMVGYGLEPFVSSAAIDQILQQAGPDLATGNWTAATIRVIEATERLLESSSISVAEGFGLSPFVSLPPRDF